MSTTKEPDDPPSSIYWYLGKVREELPTVAKSGHNDFHKYDYASESDILDAVNPLFIKHGIMMFPTVNSIERVDTLTTIMVKWTFVHTETGVALCVDIPGTGEDKGDKGLYKALTGSQKYTLTKVLGISTGDDPEKSNGNANPAPRSVVTTKPKFEAPAQAAPANGTLMQGLLENVTQRDQWTQGFCNKKRVFTNDPKVGEAMVYTADTEVVLGIKPGKKPNEYWVQAVTPVQEAEEEP